MRLLAVFGVLTCTNAELAADIGQLVMASLSEENSSQVLLPVAAPGFLHDRPLHAAFSSDQDTVCQTPQKTTYFKPSFTGYEPKSAHDADRW